MNTDAILAAIDEEIHRLQSARQILAVDAVTPVKKGPGRPKKETTVAAVEPVKRVMSAEARARIAAAQKKRWAATKKASK